MNELDLTSDDFELLLKSVSAWENEPGSDGMMSAVMGMLMCDNKVQREKVMKEERDKSTKEVNNRKNRAIMLKAKLVYAKSYMDSNEKLKQVAADA